MQPIQLRPNFAHLFGEIAVLLFGSDDRTNSPSGCSHGSIVRQPTTGIPVWPPTRGAFDGEYHPTDDRRHSRTRFFAVFTIVYPIVYLFSFLGVAHKRSANLFALRGASFALVLWTLGRPVSICTQADPLSRLISPLCRLPQLANGGRTQQRCRRFGHILTNVPVSGSTFTPRSHSVRGLLRCNLSTRRSRSLSGFAEQPSLAYGCASHARIPVPTNRLYSG